MQMKICDAPFMAQFQLPIMAILYANEGLTIFTPIIGILLDQSASPLAWIGMAVLVAKVQCKLITKAVSS
jgi:hypothetical protein